MWIVDYAKWIKFIECKKIILFFKLFSSYCQVYDITRKMKLKLCTLSKLFLLWQQWNIIWKLFSAGSDLWLVVIPYLLGAGVFRTFGAFPWKPHPQSFVSVAPFVSRLVPRTLAETCLATQQIAGGKIVRVRMEPTEGCFAPRSEQLNLTKFLHTSLATQTQTISGKICHSRLIFIQAKLIFWSLDPGV